MRERNLLGQFIDVFPGYAFASKQFNEIGKGKPLIRIRDLKEQAIRTYFEGDYEQIFIVKKGDLLVGMDGDFNAIKWGNSEGLLNQRLCKLRTKDSKILDQNYLEYVIKPELQKINLLTPKTTVKHLSPKDIFAIKRSIPSLEKQRKIAEALSDCDYLIESLKKLISKKVKIKKGAVQELLSGRKRLSDFNDEWDVKTFGEIFNFLSTATNSRKDLSEDGDTYYIHYGDIHTKFQNHLDFRIFNIPKIQRYKCKNATSLKNGDWVMADASEDYEGIGKTIEILGLKTDSDAISGLHTFLLREKQPTFIIEFKGHLGELKSLHDQYLRVTTGLKVYGISKRALENLELAIPSKEEQKAITEILSDMDKEINILKLKLNNAKALKSGMIKELLKEESSQI